MTEYAKQIAYFRGQIRMMSILAKIGNVDIRGHIKAMWAVVELLEAGEAREENLNHSTRLAIDNCFISGHAALDDGDLATAEREIRAAIDLIRAD